MDISNIRAKAFSIIVIVFITIINPITSSGKKQMQNCACAYQNEHYVMKTCWGVDV
jgi:hypothetical protein